MGQGLDFEVFSLNSPGIVCGLVKQCLNYRRHLGFSCGIEVQPVDLSQWIHDPYYTLTHCYS